MVARESANLSASVEDYLDLLGARCRDLPQLRSTFAELLINCAADQEPFELDEQYRVQRLLERLATPVPAGHCPVCAQAMPPASIGRARRYCTDWCGDLVPKACIPGDPQTLGAEKFAALGNLRSHLAEGTTGTPLPLPAVHHPDVAGDGEAAAGEDLGGGDPPPPPPPPHLMAEISQPAAKGTGMSYWWRAWWAIRP
ncbi:hypothetical protein GCM10010441_78120 [Kitasatospora paracochleata]|uniref:Uncharacterized protein n=1 Tax=Kitasatospora paracochleata TaxID=58354 RepID=A0ABT1JBW8_9ACTN|nr:hypothetical protein [Kitasatospora paracochleata]MCP2314654.1 hypothetical protein [Kitasatospora paracochleata]